MEITIKLGERSYPVIFDSVEGFFVRLRTAFPRSRFALVTNTTLESLYREQLARWEEQLGIVKHVMPDGERFKTLDTWSAILDTLLGAKLDRSAVLIAFGGGVVGDLAGFAAAAFLRGIDYVQIPTTLLAMVDSSVGGKTAVDHRAGKNLIGAFHQPRMVLIDTNFLKTLQDREYMAGYAELFKYAFIGGRDMFDFVNDFHPALCARDPQILSDGIRKSIEIKGSFVEQDEHETTGMRALLNFGHTFAHSLENFFGYENILHGEAVWWGMKCAFDLGIRAGTVSEDDRGLLGHLVDKIPLPRLPGSINPDAIYDGMFSDKKVAAGKIRFILPAGPGSSIVKDTIGEQLVKETLKEILM